MNEYICTFRSDIFCKYLVPENEYTHANDLNINRINWGEQIIYKIH